MKIEREVKTNNHQSTTQSTKQNNNKDNANPTKNANRLEELDLDLLSEIKGAGNWSKRDYC